jgi:anti-sigma B factor antagonist
VPGPPLSVALRRDGSATVAAVTGELDLASGPALLSALEPALRERPALLVLDLGGLTFLDASGASALQQVASRQAAAGGRTALRRVRRPVRRVLDLLGLQSALPEA